MSYREENGQVILTMSREDYVELDSSIKLVQLFEEKLDIPPIQRKAAYLRDRLNSGNPNYTPYQIVSDKITQPWVRREDLHSRCCDAPVMVGDDDVCSSCGRPCSHTPYQVEEKKI